MPLLIHTDQGRNFESKLMAEVCGLLDIKKTRTTAYHPQSDGMVERFNQTLEAQLSKFADHSQRDWDQHIPFLLRTLASCWNKEKFRCYEAQIEESEKASSHRESNPGHLACAASALPLSYDNRTTTSPHNPLYVLHRWD